MSRYTKLTAQASVQDFELDLECISIHDAFVIASRDQTKSFLVEQANLKEVVPVDMKLLYESEAKQQATHSSDSEDDQGASVMMAVRNGGSRVNGDTGTTNGEHREMAIDVPSSFVPQPKAKPRLSNSFGKESEDKREKLKKYQGEVDSRKETERRLARQQEFLRASLRESKKLQNLEQKRTNGEAVNGGGAKALPDGFVNNAFDDERHSLHPSASATPEKGGKLQVEMKPPTDTVSVQAILAVLQALRSKLGNNSSELRLMSQLVNNAKFQDAVALHNKVQEAKINGVIPPASSDSAQDAAESVYAYLEKTDSTQAQQLSHILKNPSMQGVLLSHDILAKTEPEKEDDDDDETNADKAGQYGETSVKIVTILKTADPLGATVRNEGEAVVIGRIVRGGVAEKSGLLHEGDEILEVNSIPLRGKTINDVSDMLAGMTGPLQFVIVPGGVANGDVKENKVVSVRAEFDYDPEEDTYIPCQELGISFQIGDILHIINQDDPNWWQAYREGEDDQTLAGLIPSKVFQETKEQVHRTYLAEKVEAEADQPTCCPSGRKRRKKIKFDAMNADSEEILTYEEVSQYFPQPNRKRPIVLIGPPDVGRKELRERLFQSDSDRFAAAIPHTSRPKREEEVDGKDYYFTARHVFEADIRANKFVEHGQYESDYYGTSLEAISTVVMSGKICVLNLHPQALKILKASDVKPYVVFVAPPNLEKLRLNMQRSGRDPTVDQLKAVIDKAREMEKEYSHFFDYIIRNTDYDRAYDELLTEINRLEVEPQWIPTSWLRR